MKKFSGIMEIFWLLTAIATAIIAGYTIQKKVFGEACELLLFPVAALDMFGLRRFLRKKMEKHSDDNKGNK